MTRRPRPQLPEIGSIACDDDPIFHDRLGENVFVRRAEKPAVADMDGVESVHRSEVMSQQRRQIFVDQEARRHSLPLGRPRGGFAFA